MDIAVLPRRSRSGLQEAGPSPGPPLLLIAQFGGPYLFFPFFPPIAFRGLTFPPLISISPARVMT